MLFLWWISSNFKNFIWRDSCEKNNFTFSMNDVLLDIGFLQTFFNKYFENHSAKVCLCNMKYTIEYFKHISSFLQYDSIETVIHQLINGKLEWASKINRRVGPRLKKLKNSCDVYRKITSVYFTSGIKPKCGIDW